MPTPVKKSDRAWWPYVVVFSAILLMLATLAYLQSRESSSTASQLSAVRQELAEMKRAQPASKTAAPVERKTSAGAAYRLMTSVSANWQDKSVTFEHRCFGTVEGVGTPTGDSDAGPGYCLGKNQLVAVDGDGNEQVMDETTLVNPSGALALQGVSSIASGRVVLVSYGVDACFTFGNCGLGDPSNHVSFQYDLATRATAYQPNYPAYGTLRWNAKGTKAVFLLPVCGGAGCDAPVPVKLYDLAKDVVTNLTSETGAESVGAKSNQGDAIAYWKELTWKDADTVTVTRVTPDGKEKVFTIDVTP